MYWLVRALLWVKDEENSRIALSQTAAQWSGCHQKITVAQGHYLCCQCYDTDPCKGCMAKYADTSSTLLECEGHEYCDVTIAACEPPMSSMDVEMWIDTLKEKYLTVASC